MRQQTLKSITNILVVSLLLTACTAFKDAIPERQSQFVGLEDVVFDVAAFERIKIEANGKYVITEAAEQSVIVATNPDHLKNISVSVVDGELIIKHIGRHSEKRYTSVTIATPNISSVYIDAFLVAELNDINTKVFDFTIDAIGTVEINGSCGYGTFVIDAIGDFDSSDFLCKNVIAEIDGIGSVVIFASETIEIDGGGIGDITVRGRPQVKRSSFFGVGSNNIR